MRTGSNRCVQSIDTTGATDYITRLFGSTSSLIRSPRDRGECLLRFAIAKRCQERFCIDSFTVGSKGVSSITKSVDCTISLGDVERDVRVDRSRSRVLKLAVAEYRRWWK